MTRLRKDEDLKEYKFPIKKVYQIYFEMIRFEIYWLWERKNWKITPTSSTQVLYELE